MRTASLDSRSTSISSSSGLADLQQRLAGLHQPGAAIDDRQHPSVGGGAQFDTAGFRCFRSVPGHRPNQRGLRPGKRRRRHLTLGAGGGKRGLADAQQLRGVIKRALRDHAAVSECSRPVVLRLGVVVVGDTLFDPRLGGAQGRLAFGHSRLRLLLRTGV